MSSAFVALERVVGGNASGGVETGGDSRDGRLAHFGERVVGAGRKARDRHRAALADHRAMRAVAAEHDDRGGARLAHQLRGAKRVVDAGGDGHVEPVDRGEARRRALAPQKVALQHHLEAFAVRHHQHALDPHDASADSSRSTMLTRSASCRLLAFAITRRMSRAEIGFAMMPTSGGLGARGCACVVSMYLFCGNAR